MMTGVTTGGGIEAGIVQSIRRVAAIVKQGTVATRAAVPFFYVR